MTSKKKNDEEEFISPQLVEAQQEFDRKMLLADASRRQTGRQLAAAKKQIELLQEENEHLLAHIDTLLVPPVKNPGWGKKPKKKSKAHIGIPVLVVSDTHYGENVDLSQMNGLNKYNPDIATYRTKRMFERTIYLARDFFAGVEYEGIYVPLLGDLVSGSIHDELDRTNELSLHESVKFAHDVLKPGIEMLAEEFGKVHVVSAPGNHGRHFRKVTYKNFSAENADTAVARWLASAFEDEKDITFNIPNTMDVNWEIYGYTFAAEHGQAFRFSGQAEIGSIGPVTRGTLRKGKQMSVEENPFNYNLMGHFHQYMPMNATVYGFGVNGSMVGYNEFARGLHFVPEEPKQMLFLVTPEFGATHNTPVFVSDRDEEGW